ncbi:MAG: CidA/LrgA family protein [Xanthobacteraceae bacterium]|nr:CidA/LrgA family protein [Xanthobacteraceae bacterium]
MSPQVRTARFVRHSAILQAGIVIAFWLLGEAAVRIAHLPFPGALIGLALLIVLLATRRMKLSTVQRGAKLLLADMLLFFVPAVLVVLNHQEFLGLTGLKILAVILTSTTAVMVVTVFAVDRCYRWRLARVPVASRSR